MNIEPLKKKIQEANPEIMELKFGCEVVYEKKICKYLTHVDGFFDVMLPPDYNYGILQVTNPKLKIFGRPIRLADVLVALQTNNVEVDLGSFIHKVSELENMHLEKNVLRIRRGTVVSWNLLDDNLDHQSDECKQFLIDILV